MRHRVYGKKLGRTKNQRSGLFKSLIQSLFTYGTIETSEAKAKAIKGMVDKIINLAKNKNSQRLLQAYFSNKLLQERLVKEIAPKLGNRNSGYTSLVRLGVREGDRTTVVRMSIIGVENLKPLEKKVTGNRSSTPRSLRLEEVQGTVKKIDEVKKEIPKKKVKPEQSTKKVRPAKKTSKKSAKK